MYHDRIVQRGGEGIVNDEFYDVVLELAAYAKKHIEAARKIQEETPLPPHAHRALLIAQEVDYFLEILQLNNFNVFDGEHRKSSFLKVPYRFYSAAKANKF